MCGIAGIINFNGRPVEPEELARFAGRLAHRGPDGSGVFTDPQAGVGLAHHRLAILDRTSRADQPMVSAGGREVMVYNGEVYNFLELRRELIALGHGFATSGDTEVVLRAYQQWGEGCFERFNGMWALAIWDRQERSLLLCRDRFGVKPLFFLHENNRLTFASEQRAFFSLSGYRAEIDEPGLALSICRPAMFEGTPRTILRGVERLTGGYFLRLAADGTVCTRRWWNTLDRITPPPASYAEQVEGFRELLLDACRIRMRSDVPLGTSLSGGLDSSSVLAAVHGQGRAECVERLPEDWQRAFVAAYPGTSHDETVYAQAVADHLGISCERFDITPETLADHAARVVADFGEVSDIPVGPWLAYRRQRELGIVVSLDGHGGDELLGGYHRHHHPLMTEAALSPQGRQRFKELSSSLAAMFEPGHPSHVPGAEELKAGREAAGGSVLREYYPEAGRRVAAHPWLRSTPAEPVLPQLEEDAPRLAGCDPLFVALYVDYHCTELPTNLRDYDRLSMAHGVEVRSPFCDWRLACYGFSLPSNAKIGGGYSKRVLRDAMTGILPEMVRLRRAKIGFANPRAEWRQALKPLVMDVVRSRAFRDSPYWKGEEIARAVERGYAENVPKDVDRAWIFVTASLLLESFTP